MKQISGKLKKEQGSSIVLVLLFMLVCLTVGGSLLMAASSNSGRDRSSRQEQQAYFALSSALRMVADDLVNTKYYGVSHCESKKTEETETSGKKIITTMYTHERGLSQCQGSILGGVLLDNFDCLFMEVLKEYVNNLKSSSEEESDGEGNRLVSEYEVKEASFSDVENTPQTLTVTIPDLVQLNGFEVTVNMDVKETYGIELTARLTKVPEKYKNGSEEAENKYDGYVLKAEMMPVGNVKIEEDGKNRVGDFKSTPMSWKLSKITRPQQTESVGG